MLFLQAWVLFPAVLLVLSLGWGLLVDRAAGGRVRGVLLIPVGLAGIFVAARAAMSTDATAELGTPLVAAGAVVGLVLGAGRLRGTAVDRWATGAAVAVFAVFAAPIVFSGSATFAGYTVLGDTAVHFILADWIASHGTETGSLQPSSYQQTLQSYFGSGYPLGTHAALAAVRPLAFADVSWLFQPFVCFLAASLALTLYGLASTVVRQGWRSAAIAFLAAQPALVYAFAMQGSVKEIATLWLVPLVAVLVAGLAVSGRTAPGTAGLREVARAVLPLGVAVAAALAAIGLAAIVWLGPLLLAAAWIVARRWHTASAHVRGRGPGLRRLRVRPVGSDPARFGRVRGRRRGGGDQRDRAREPVPAAEAVSGLRDLAHGRLPHEPSRGGARCHGCAAHRGGALRRSRSPLAAPPASSRPAALPGRLAHRRLRT